MSDICGHTLSCYGSGAGCHSSLALRLLLKCLGEVRVNSSPRRLTTSDLHASASGDPSRRGFIKLLRHQTLFSSCHFLTDKDVLLYTADTEKGKCCIILPFYQKQTCSLLNILFELSQWGGSLMYICKRKFILPKGSNRRRARFIC